jgi:hypothetical protein
MSAFIGLLALDIVVAKEEQDDKNKTSVACGIRLLGVFLSLGVSTAKAIPQVCRQYKIKRSYI